MRYLGSKKRFAPAIADIVLDLARRHGLTQYVEPFVGGAAVGERIFGIPRVMSDINAPLIQLYRAVAQGWQPPTSVSADEYARIRDRPDQYPAELVAFVGFGCSFGGKWFGGYARGGGRNYAAEAARSLLAQRPRLEGARFYCCDYRFVPPYGNSIWYLDPPYAGTTSYAGTPTFAHGPFWSWVRALASRSFVLISEYTAPEGFRCVWEQPTKTQIRSTGENRRIERLFLARPE